jgi:hypothetical protein
MPEFKDSVAAASFTVASYNIHQGVGWDGRRDPSRVAQILLASAMCDLNSPSSIILISVFLLLTQEFCYHVARRHVSFSRRHNIASGIFVSLNQWVMGYSIGIFPERNSTHNYV